MIHHRRARAVGIFVAVALFLGLVPATSAAADVVPLAAPQQVSSVSVSRSGIALAWAQSTDAVRYEVAYSTSSSMKSAKYLKSTRPYAEVKKLKASKTYYLAVRAVFATPDEVAGPWSAPLKVKTKSKSAANTYLAPAGLTADTPGTDRVTLRWTSRGSGLRYRIAVATNNTFSNAEYRYVKGTQATITKLVDGVDYFFRIRVVTSGGKARSPESRAIKVLTAAHPVTGGSSQLAVASYNVGSKSVTKGGTWGDRRAAVVATVLSQRPDVIGFQEASQGKLSGKNLSQAEDLVNRLGAPYALANTARYNCKNPSTPHKCSYKYQGAANSQKIVYNTDRLTLVKQGSKRTSSSKKKMTVHRYVEWAILRDKTNGRKLFFVNVHLDPGSTSSARKYRKKQVKEILAVIKAQNPWKLPTLVVGDFNSHKWSEPSNQPYDMMVAAGYVDPLGNTYHSTHTAPGATVVKRINTHYSSYNYWKRTPEVKQTWFEGAKRPWINGIYLDYIWTSRGIEVPEWETVLNLDANGRLVGRIPSDHNMLRATVVIR